MRLLLAAVLFSGCAHERVWVDEQNGLYYHILEENYPGDFVLEYVMVQPAAVQHQTSGINLSYKFAVSNYNSVLMRDANDFGYDSYRMVARLLLPDGTPVAHTQHLLTSDSLQAVVEQRQVFRTTTYQPPAFFFPYRDLHLPHGTRQVLVELRGYPEQKGKPQQTHPDLVLKVEVGFGQPRLFIGEVGVLSYEIDTDKTDPHKFDFRMTGTGYPDLCWWLYCGSQLVHRSEVVKNQIRFGLAGSCNPFVLAETDSIRLLLYDDDELSDHDLIGSWRGRLVELAARSSPEKPLNESLHLARNCRFWATAKPLFE